MPLTYAEVITTPDCPTIRFKQARESVALEAELRRILQTQGWGCGTYFHVQFLSREGDELYSQALFVVTCAREVMETSDANPTAPTTRLTHRYHAERIGDWWGAVPDEEIPQEKNTTPGERHVRWNPGKKMHQVLEGDTVIFESARKAEIDLYLAA